MPVRHLETPFHTLSPFFPLPDRACTCDMRGLHGLSRAQLVYFRVAAPFSQRLELALSRSRSPETLILSNVVGSSSNAVPTVHWHAPSFFLAAPFPPSLEEAQPMI
ncbi:uncharacterized protein MONBRDRAFT_34635 [Monosiga brevicollis MX1]|uniref:Uncharacterized protein n=1 Tax=Monosiga brevicollis TaxID=81824 RepID=A9VD04_MONBE|nr:uncharacterized protein MONBRDRAFT_34635 [Monosiga brevicollis MX1]EDQ84593.1 predicted protein [Monosiga brevicollis MX1]|eukprot:XP_001750620.1 hypothetical protein [Monosiga brevicollis MX1]